MVGLYPNNPHNGGLAALRKAIDTRENKTISTDTLLELTGCVLQNNIFEHSGNIFKQKQDTAIGTKMGSPFAVLFLADLEEQFLASSPLKPFVWWRYIDNIFMIWQYGEENLKNFLENLNSCHPTIKFTADYSYEKINFLDVQLTRCEDRLVTHQYRHASSCHVFHSKMSIPYSQTLRFNRICSEGALFDRRCNEL